MSAEAGANQASDGGLAHFREELPARFIELVGRLYRVESDAPREGLDAQALPQLRQQRSAQRAGARADPGARARAPHGVLPASLLGKALHYLDRLRQTRA